MKTLMVLSALLSCSMSLASGGISFGSTGASSYLCDVQSTTGVKDRLGLNVSTDELLHFATQEKDVHSRLSIQTLHKRSLPTEDLVLTPFDSIFLASVPADRQRFEWGYNLNEQFGAGGPVAAFPLAPPTLLEFLNNPIQFVIANKRMATVTFTASITSSGSVYIHVQDGGQFWSNTNILSTFSIEYFGTCVQQADNTNFGF